MALPFKAIAFSGRKKRGAFRMRFMHPEGSFEFLQ
jgi:hypothetical protein